MSSNPKHQRNRAGGGRLESVSGSLLVRRFTVRQPEMYRVVEAVSVQRLARLDKAALCELAQAVMDADYDNLDGDLVRVPGGSGGEIVVMAHAKRRSRELVVADTVFADPQALTQLRRILEEHGTDERSGVRLMGDPVEGLSAQDGPVALASVGRLGTELLASVLERLIARLVAGGQIIVDDSRDPETRRAIEAALRGKKGYRIERKSGLHILRA
ncbi:MAG: hypothetical protein MOGMAGMI_00189 [Candidatus Omnitrophica bacterium]|nr:hypothetical protein [Candidatus Omnitrophota bacterium]